MSASRSVSNRSATLEAGSLGLDDVSDIASHRSSSRRVSCSNDSAAGLGTIRLRLKKPTAFSTLPFSLPEYGLQKRTSMRWCEANEANTCVSVTSPSRSRWPAPVALSITSTDGTPPMRSNTIDRPEHRHSAFSPGIATA